MRAMMWAPNAGRSAGPVHHDALEFPDGEIVLVTRLYPGQHATVLQLPALPSGVNDREQPSHAAAE